MSDVPEKRKEINQEDLESKGLIRSSIGQINRERSAKNEKQ